MNPPVCLASLIFLVSAASSQAAVTLGFSTGTNIAEGWANSSGSQTVGMVWGIIVDPDGDGFDGFLNATSVASDGGFLLTSGATYNSSFEVAGTINIPGGQQLSADGVLTDDRIYLANTPMPLVSGDVRMGQITNMTYSDMMAAGDKYVIVWFDRTAMGGVMPSGSIYGAWYKNGSTPNTATVLPPDPGSWTTAANGPAGMFGGDETASIKQASLVMFIPEPSSALLGVFGALGLLRRRR